MNKLRFIFCCLVLLLLCAGYFGSQYFALSGNPQAWMGIVDSPGIVFLALAVLLAAIALAFIRESEPEEKQ